MDANPGQRPCALGWRTEPSGWVSRVRLQGLLAIPLALGALGLGYGAQSLSSRPQVGQESALLEAFMAAPPPAADTHQSAQELRQLRAQRSANGLAEPSAGSPVDLEIRVALLAASQEPNLSATGRWQLVGRGGQLLERGQPGQLVNLDLFRRTAPEAWLQSDGAALVVNGNPYAGRIRIVNSGGSLSVINHLPLETYIQSVVGSEMPSSWSIEALKAQAVAARSYALAHMARPANRYWHLGDNTRWQAYRGLEATTPRTRQATASTAGLILSYQGAIVESLYAATRAITQEAHGHLGASMSQHGAQELAQQGMRYNAILGSYYQGASLARLRSGSR
ncbi:SpoIID/LytB domain-containing protein [Cyanobium sp. WAJ14-Wanaka]|nr:SpoIID/LytB domain-containing protein [Cyanobium sp. WAJ14-Wanaka]